MAADTSKLGVLAGGGSAPRRIIEACQAKNRDYFVICLEGQCDPETARGTPHVWLPLGAFGKLRDLVLSEKIGEMLMIGHVRRPSLLEVKLDWLAIKALAKISVNLLGDDAFLRVIGNAIEQECKVRVIGIQDVLGGALTREGIIGKIKPDHDAEHDITRGITIARALGHVDVGQSVVVQQGLVLGVEAIEGTDALMERCGKLHREGPGGVLVKVAKPQQDNRFDLPTIGPDTITAAAKAGIRGIAVEAGRSLLLDPERVKQMADEMGLFVVGIR